MTTSNGGLFPIRNSIIIIIIIIIAVVNLWDAQTVSQYDTVKFRVLTANMTTAVFWDIRKLVGTEELQTNTKSWHKDVTLETLEQMTGQY
jgi:hypothetical protein